MVSYIIRKSNFNGKVDYFEWICLDYNFENKSTFERQR